jgi:hypothetical protein
MAFYMVFEILCRTGSIDGSLWHGQVIPVASPVASQSKINRQDAYLWTGSPFSYVERYGLNAERRFGM